MAVEDHGSGNQYIRLAAWPLYSKLGLTLSIAGMASACAAAASREILIAGVLAAGSVALFSGAVLEAGRSLANILAATRRQKEPAMKERRRKVIEAMPARPSVAKLRQASAGGSESDARYSAQ
jgi:hypothetical protein